MPEIKTLTVRYLRELARKHLGKGHSRLKTKEELLAALKGVPGALKGILGIESEDEATPVRPRAAAPAEVVRFPSSTVAARTVREATANGRSPASSPPPGPPAAASMSAEPPLAEPVEEAFFVAKVAGEEEARRHHLTGIQEPPPPGPPVYDEHLGELPVSYTEDDVVLLARDPRTLFVFWNVTPDTRQQAASGLEQPRAVLRVFEGGQLVREQDFALESRSYYLQGLEPGHRYRAELHFVGRDGTSRRVGPSSNAVALPASGPSADTTLRFLKVLWETPLSKLRESLRAGQAALREELEPRRYIEWVWKRIPLPGSAGFRDEATPHERLEYPTPPPGPVPTHMPTPSGMGMSSPSSHTWAGSGTFGKPSGSGRGS